jgi:hypothetical protein
VNGKGVIRLSNNGLCMCSKAMHVHKIKELKLISLITYTYYYGTL